MGRARKSRMLTVWMNGEHVGEWRHLANGAEEFVYAEAWLASPAARPISLSLPLRPSNEAYRQGVSEFFDNLLPDNQNIRERIQRRFRSATSGAFDLLQEIGRDCIGALQLLPEGHSSPDVRKITGERLRSQQVAEILAESLNPAFGRSESSNDTFRISLAGAQEKTALLWHKGAWHRPTAATPTTHILKLPIGMNSQRLDLSTSVENEWLCAKIAKAYGLFVAPCEMETFGGQKVLVVERFDRTLAQNGDWWIRVPQEDFCQATATSPALKYESDGGPGIRKIMELLLGSERNAEDRREFMRTQLVFWLLAAIDGHAKNFSIFLLPDSAYRLTPRYDILSAYPMMGRSRGKLSHREITMAMAVWGNNRHYRWREISARHWEATARDCGFTHMRTLMQEVIEETPRVIEQIGQGLPRNFPNQIAESILEGLKKSAKQLADQLSRERD